MKKKIIVILSIFLFLSTNFALAEVSQQDAQRYGAYYSNGLEYLKNQQYRSAIIELKKVLRFSPYDETVQDALINAYYSYGQYYKQSKEYKNALIEYKNAVFYGKYWTRKTVSQSVATLITNSIREINELEKRLTIAQNESSRLQDARILKAQGELAASGYDYQLLKDSSYSEVAYENLGGIYKNLNNQASAIDYYRKAIEINPKNALAHFEYGIILDEARNYDASIEQFNLALQYGDNSPELLEILQNKWTQNIVNDPNNAQNYISLGAIYQKRGLFDEAKAQYIKASQLDPNDKTALYNLASLFIQQKRYPEALNVYNQLLQKDPKNIEILEYKAQIYSDLKQYDEELKQYEYILALDPNNKKAKEKQDSIIYNDFTPQKLQNYLISKANSNPTSYNDQFNCALELHKNKNYPQAINYYKKAQALNPSKDETYINLASIYIEQKDYKNATTICQKGLLISPNDKTLNQYLADIKSYNINSQYELASKLFEEKKYSEAINAYLKIEEQTKEIKSTIALCYWELGDFKNANKYYLELLALEPNDVELNLNSALAYYNLKDYQNSKKMAQKVLLIEKNNKDAINILEEINNVELDELLQNAIAKFDTSDYNSSLILLNKYLQANPNNEYAIYYKGLCLEELKKPLDAIKEYKSLISKKPDFLNGYYSLALALDNQENYKEAVSNYRKYLDLRNNEKDQMTEFVESRVKELEDYLGKVK